ncbi:MAG: nucleoside-triphosphatase [Candidatus Woesearchaeota archaeon]
MNNIIITGMPRCGKTTILKEVISYYNQKVGFVTNEIICDGERIGFEIETFNYNKITLAHINFKSKLKVSKYFVNINNLDSIIKYVNKYDKDELLFLDEIGEMELYSDKFKKLVIDYLDSDNVCIATLSKVFCNDFIEKIKQRKDCLIIDVYVSNRDSKTIEIKQKLKKLIDNKN